MRAKTQKGEHYNMSTFPPLLRPLTSPTPEFFQSNIPYEHESLLLEAKSLYKRPSSPDHLRQWESLSTQRPVSPLSQSCSGGRRRRSNLTSQALQLVTIHSPTRARLSLAKDELNIFDEERASVNSTPRSIHAKSAYFSAQANRYGKRPATTSNSIASARKAALILRQNEELGYKFRLLDPMSTSGGSENEDEDEHANMINSSSSLTTRPQTTGLSGRKRRRPSQNRAILSFEMDELLKHVKTLRGVHVEGKEESAEQKFARQLAERAQRENVPQKRQPGDTKGLSGRVRVNIKIGRFRDPNQLAALMNSLGMKWKPTKKKKTFDEEFLHSSSQTMEGNKEHEQEEKNKNQKQQTTAVLNTPRKLEQKRKEWGNKIRQRQELVKVKRDEIIQAELQHIYDVGSSYKLARKQQAANDRLSSRKVARGWNRMMWRWIACQHFHTALGRGRQERATRMRQQLAQVKIASSYRRKQSYRELKSRKRASYMLKLHLKRIVRRWKARRRQNDADVLRKWLSTTKNFSKRVLGYLLLKRSAETIQLAWRTFRATKKKLIEKLSLSMYSVATSDHGYRQIRRTTLQKIPALSPMPPMDIRYELLGKVLRPMRKQWMDKAMPK